MTVSPTNTFLTGPLGPIYLKTALPIIFVMGMSGLLSVADALFLGHFVGPEALAAVTLMFPIYMLIVSLATLVSGGMSSLLARHLGGNRTEEAGAVFAGAHGLALAAAGLLIVGFLAIGEHVVHLAAGGSDALAAMGLTYLRITIFCTPLVFILSVNSDALRNEGRIGFMAAMSLLASVANIGFNYVLIGVFEMGVAGSAYGTALAQALAFAIILGFRLNGTTVLRPVTVLQHRLTSDWRGILALGAPQSLNFIGLALGSAVVMATLQWVRTPEFEYTISAYGIITRVLTFGFLPLLGLSHAMQTITGNNYGAEGWQRSNISLRIGLTAALIYCGIVQFALTVWAPQIGAMFVDNPTVIDEVARILPIILTLFFIAGPLMMIATHFQAIGDAPLAALLGLTKPYLFVIPLTFGLAVSLGEPGIWAAGPVAEALLLCLTVLVLIRTQRSRGLRWGLFRTDFEKALVRR
ncbi:MATE family efflux transporter [Phaeobacter marinintestinus]|uniref:MATE family efflux transporter n=1 Tax=Falsiphaeobacter marinintestinus TaxID=1492905 RepID=UPI0011B3BC35|nr:MATE family efflux transporter [Phaeobacter marinintestinus]